MFKVVLLAALGAEPENGYLAVPKLERGRVNELFQDKRKVRRGV
jgi:hypothetical protein